MIAAVGWMGAQFEDREYSKCVMRDGGDQGSFRGGWRWRSDEDDAFGKSRVFICFCGTTNRGVGSPSQLTTILVSNVLGITHDDCVFSQLKVCVLVLGLAKTRGSRFTVNLRSGGEHLPFCACCMTPSVMLS